MKTIKDLPISTHNKTSVGNAYMVISGEGVRDLYTDRIAFPVLKEFVTGDLEARLKALENLGGGSGGSGVGGSFIEIIEKLKTDIANVTAAIREEKIVRADADKAEAISRQSLFSQYQTDVSDAQASIVRESITRANAFEAEAIERLKMDAKFTDLNSTATASLLEEKRVRADADAAEASARQTLKTTFEAEFVKTNAAVDTEVKARSSAIEAEASARQTLKTTFEGEFTKTNAAIDTETKARSTAIEAEASARQSLKTSLETEITKTNASVDTETKARVSAVEAEASARQTLKTTVEGEFTKTNAAIVNESKARSTAIEAEAEKRELLEASFKAAGTGAGNLLSNTDFPTLDGWTPGSTNPSISYSHIINAAGDPWHPAGENVLSLFQTNGPVTSNSRSSHVQALSNNFAVPPGGNIQFYVFGAAHRAFWTVIIYYYDVNGIEVGNTASTDRISTQIDNGGKTITAFERIGMKTTVVPSTAATAKMVLRKFDTEQGQTNSYFWALRPFVSVASPTQEAWNEYSPGSSRAVQIETIARIGREEKARADAVSAEATRVDTLLTGYATNGSVDTKVSAEATDRTSAISSAVGAEATRVNTLLTGYATNGSVDTKVSAEATSRTNAISNAVSAEATRVDTLLTSYATNGSVDTKISAEATSRTNAISTAVGGQASRIDSLVTTIGNASSGLVSQVNSYSNSISDLTTKQQQANWGVVTSTPGGVASIELKSSTNGGGAVEIVGNTTFRGNLNVGPDSGQRMKITSSSIIIYDANNIPRVKLGLF